MESVQKEEEKGTLRNEKANLEQPPLESNQWKLIYSEVDDSSWIHCMKFDRCRYVNILHLYIKMIIMETVTFTVAAVSSASLRGSSNTHRLTMLLETNA